jgi:hypothetical protein
VRNWSNLPSHIPARQNRASPLRPFPFRLRDNNADGVLNRAVLIFFLQTMHERHTWAKTHAGTDAVDIGEFWAGPLIGLLAGTCRRTALGQPSSALRPASLILMRTTSTVVPPASVTISRR